MDMVFPWKGPFESDANVVALLGRGSNPNHHPESSPDRVTSFNAMNKEQTLANLKTILGKTPLKEWERLIKESRKHSHDPQFVGPSETCHICSGSGRDVIFIERQCKTCKGTGRIKLDLIQRR